MLDKDFLNFSVDRKSFSVTFLSSSGEEKLSFDAFYKAYLSKSALKISGEDYNKETLRAFCKSAPASAEISFPTEEPGVSCRFKVVGKEGSVLRVEVALLEKELSADFDYLTGVHSRNFLFSSIQKELQRGNNDSAYLIMIDLDNFKTINDMNGHLVGDVCLKTIANDLAKIFEGHIFGRYGGDEFLAFIKDIDEMELQGLAKKALSVRFYQGHAAFGKDFVSCSLGISNRVGNRNSLNELIQEADKALYQSKKAGKNLGTRSDGALYRGELKAKKKKRKPSLTAKSAPSLIFKEEIARKRLLHMASVAGAIFLFAALTLSVDFAYNHQVTVQTRSTASSLMKERSDLASSKATSSADEAIAKLNASKEILNDLTAEDQITLLDKMLASLSEHALVHSPGLLLENGDIYYEGGKRHNISSFTLARKIIVEGESAVERISVFGEGDSVVAGVPYSRTFVFSGDNVLNIVGIVSMFSEADFSTLVFGSFDENYYAAIVDSDGFKIAESSNSSISIFSSYSNLTNYFRENDYADGAAKFREMLGEPSADMTFMSLGGTDYFIYSSAPLADDWTILMVVPYWVIYGTFSNTVNFTLISINVLFAVLLVLAVSSLVYIQRIRLQNFSAKYIDPLTQSINEQRFLSDANVLVSRGGEQRYLVYLNIRRFKIMNTTVGSKSANEFLASVSSYFENCLKGDELTSREYSDRFLLLLSEIDDESLLNRVEEITTGLLNSGSLNAYSQLSFDIGVYRFDRGSLGKIPAWLAVDRAKKAAMETQRANGKAYGIKFFTDKMLEEEELEVYIEESHETALREHKFIIYYQGKYDLHEKRFAGCEALVRWKDERKGFINTQKFIDVFERNGFVTTLDLSIFEGVLKDIKAALEAGRIPPCVSVNLSRKHFDDENFFAEYEALIERYGVPGEYLEFEITESIILNNAFDLNALIKRIHQTGAKVSIDDFGSGFSNFSMINHVDYDILKLDRKLLFGKSGTFDESSRNVLRSVVELNKSMNKVSICEGVEHQEESDFLASIGCDEIQGYFYAKPMPKEEFLELLKKVNG